MNRPYRIDGFLKIVDRLRKRAGNISISTDIIVGYPTETVEDFELTRKVFKEAAFDMAFIFKYSPRAGTKSALMQDDVPESEKERRNSELLSELEKLRGRTTTLLWAKLRKFSWRAPPAGGKICSWGARARTGRPYLKARRIWSGNLWT